jgi:mercuric ion transport protein
MTTLVRPSRYAFAALGWALVAAIVVQVYLIGLGLFGSSDFRAVHANVGWILHIAPVIVLVAAAAAGAGRTPIRVAAGMAILIWFVPILAVLRDGSPVIAALHPVAAVGAFGLAIAVAQGATRLLDQTEARATPVLDWVVVAVVVAILLFLSFSGSPEPA